MPTYDYHCDACDHEFELFHSITEEAKRKCPKCGKIFYTGSEKKDRHCRACGTVLVRKRPADLMHSAARPATSP